MKLFDGLPTEVKALSIVCFIVAVGFGVQAPALPIFATELGAGASAVGSMISAFALMRLASAWPIGRSVNRFGERRTLIVGMALLAATSFLAGLSQAAWQLILFRALGGMGSACFSIASLSLLLRKAPPEERGRVSSLFMGALNLGLVAGPAIGGALTVFPPRYVFFLYGGVMAMAGIIATYILAHDHHLAARKMRSENALTVHEALRSPVYRAAIASNFGLGWIVYGMRASVLPLMIIGVFHAASYWIGVGLAICALLQVAVLPAAGKLTDRWGRKRPLLVGNSAYVVGLALLIALPNLPSYLVCLALMGVGAALCTTAASASVGDVTRGQGGTVVAVYQASSDLGMVVGPLAAGAIAEQSFSLALAVTAVVGVIAFGMAIFMPRPAQAPASSIIDSETASQEAN